MELDYTQELNREQLELTGPDRALEGRIESFELAFRMQAEAPELQDSRARNREATQKLYGLDDPITENFGRQCLMARRFAERGVRFVQVTHSYKWDQHDEPASATTSRTPREVDKPIAGAADGPESARPARRHAGPVGRRVRPHADGAGHRRPRPQPGGFTMWLAGGGVKPGLSYGATDDYGYYAVEDKVHIHDLHATILHLLGLDHERLTYRYAGRDFRLTDVHGNVVKDILA